MEAMLILPISYFHNIAVKRLVSQVKNGLTRAHRMKNQWNFLERTCHTLPVAILSE